MKSKDSFQSHFLIFFSFNIEGLSSKLEDHSLIEELGNYDIITLVETWLPPNRNVDFPGSYAFSKSRIKHKLAKRHSGGITVLIKTQLKKGCHFLVIKKHSIRMVPTEKRIFWNPKRYLCLCNLHSPTEFKALQPRN